MLAALASTSDATALGVTTTSAALLRASTRVRAFTGQQISAGTSTILVRGPSVRLPQRPVTDVASVTWVPESDDVAPVLLDADDWQLQGQVLRLPSTGRFEVVYDHGYATVPDAVVEVVVTVAARLGATDSAVASGVQQESSGSVSQSFGWDAWRAVSGLTSEEKAVLGRLFPRVPRTLVMRG